jgi:hypothetical protein
MDELTFVEDRLRRVYELVSRQVPDIPPSLGSDDDRLEFDDDPHQAKRRGARWRSAVIGAGISMALFGAAAGAAAASGVFASNVTNLIGPAGEIMGSQDPGAVPGAITELSSPGPDGTILTVTAASTNSNAYQAGECVALRVTLPNGQPAPGTADTGECGMIISHSAPLTPEERTEAGFAVGGVAQWTSTSGTEFTIVYGEADPGTSAVALEDAIGNIGVKANMTTNLWFAVFLPTASYERYSHIVFISADGTTNTLPG